MKELVDTQSQPCSAVPEQTEAQGSDNVYRCIPKHLFNGLTRKQRRFCVHWTGDPIHALTQAGYKNVTPTRASVNMARLLSVPNIRKIIGFINENIGEGAVIETAELRAFWKSIYRDPSCDLKDRLAASKLLGQGLGIFTEKVIMEKHTTSDQTIRVIVQTHKPLPHEQAEYDRLQRTMKEQENLELLSMGRDIIDVTPEPEDPFMI